MDRLGLPDDTALNRPIDAAAGSSSSVKAVVVIPARDEEDRIEDCLEALARQSVDPGCLEIILVADACRDRTEWVARAAARSRGLTLTVVEGPGEGSGPARRLGMDAAATRLEQLGCPGGLIATTDADSEPAEDWLERQFACLAAGAQVVAGKVELRSEDIAGLPAAVLARREQDAERRLAAVRVVSPDAGHHHFAGASLGIRAAAYRAVGGLDPTPALEDERFAQKLIEHGIPIARPADVIVRTAARTDGRARRGLSVDLAVSIWRERRRFRAADYRELTGADRDLSVAVVIPTKCCAATIGGVLSDTVGPAQAAGLVDRVLVVDAASEDGTATTAAAAGAEVIQQDTLLPQFGPAVGKGDAMWRALSCLDTDVVCFLDGDTEDPAPEHLLGLLGPMLTVPGLALVKGAFERPMRRGDELLPHEGGRVTELTARPLLNLHFPLLAGFAQPLAGEFAARRTLLEQLNFPVGYGVEIATLIDALELVGLDALAESHLGTRQNRHQSLRSLSEMAFAVLAAVERRLLGPRSSTGGQYLRPWEDGAYVRVPVAERPTLASVTDGGEVTSDALMGAQCAWSVAPPDPAVTSAS